MAEEHHEQLPPTEQVFESNWEKVTDSFEKMGLKDELIGGIYSYGFERPSRIQQLGIEPIIVGRDTITQAQSGTGKTATFAIALLEKLDLTLTQPQVLILAPTRELASQSLKVINGIGRKMKVKTCSCIGGTPVASDIESLRSGVHVVVGTPGRVLHMISEGHLDPKALRMWILDEADEMLSKGFNEQIYHIFQTMDPEVQVVLISATMPREVLEVTEKFMRDPIRILVKETELTLDGIRQYRVDVAQEDWKYETLADLYKVISVQQAIIFCNSIKKVRMLKERLTADGHIVSCIHSDMEQSERNLIMKQFRQGASRILIATNLLARGIDVQNVSLVINYDIPKSPETYLHRIGRSGRFGRKGIALNFVTTRDKESVARIQDTFGVEILDLPSDLTKVF
eukprot:gnl/Dysnectes_brevis/146_a171_9557.p1 GENE.gnl/Dysnectes_brevis/146_a171_9557~~gnl/Dysnectes_brevis/146_a171_9557.p1  ORF type:complete len:399 (+),score=129.11 gnl/Dysnectes_brevis/146_a171_9557:49-1245(+)